ncbi:hypothetical protein H5410_021390 [Solanum commersonii]|uniref:Uncharacterized protein n=1 Tax=Solanum commersonii TaxID=4109 RepID=A0A9J5ZCG6_SOLCO|nr:hypothetical protein H5410_021390 [Solanum commersonii]
MNAPRCLLSSATSGEIAIVAAGCDSHGDIVSSVEFYHSKTGTWKMLPSMNKQHKMCFGFWEQEIGVAVVKNDLYAGKVGLMINRSLTLRACVDRLIIIEASGDRRIKVYSWVLSGGPPELTLGV